MSITSKRINGDSSKNGRKKDKKMKNIYTPRPGGADDDEDHEVEQEVQTDTPAWHRHFEPDELLGRYEPIRELGTFSILY